MRNLISFILLTLTISGLSAQNLEMNIRHPVNNDTLQRVRIRLAANVSDTNAVVTMNGDTLRVYSSGVFVSLLDLNTGWNQFIFKADNKQEILRDTINVFRPEPVKSLPD